MKVIFTSWDYFSNANRLIIARFSSSSCALSVVICFSFSSLSCALSVVVCSDHRCGRLDAAFHFSKINFLFYLFINIFNAL